MRRKIRVTPKMVAELEQQAIDRILAAGSELAADFIDSKLPPNAWPAVLKLPEFLMEKPK